jgi:hypothetical protein
MVDISGKDSLNYFSLSRSFLVSSQMVFRGPTAVRVPPLNEKELHKSLRHYLKARYQKQFSGIARPAYIH